MADSYSDLELLERVARDEWVTLDIEKDKKGNLR